MATVVLHLDGPPDLDGTLTHKFRNYGEAVWSWVRENEVGSVDIAQIDRSIDRLAIRNVKAPKLRRLTRWVEDEATRHFLKISTEVVP